MIGEMIWSSEAYVLVKIDSICYLECMNYQ